MNNLKNDIIEILEDIINQSTKKVVQLGKLLDKYFTKYGRTKWLNKALVYHYEATQVLENMERYQEVNELTEETLEDMKGLHGELVANIQKSIDCL